MKKNIGFISTRFASASKVSIESVKWADIFQKNGHQVFWFAGNFEQKAENNFLVPEADTRHALNLWINEQVFGQKKRKPYVSELIHTQREFLKTKLCDFIKKFNIDILIAEDILSNPENIPLGLAFTETVAELQIPTIAHHHDFFWEKTDYSINAVNDYLRMSFPPNLPNIRHVVVNSVVQEELAHRTGISSVVIPNVLDFQNTHNQDRLAPDALKKSLGMDPSEILILQPTRLVKKKGIEHAIELVKGLNGLPCKLVITHRPKEEDIEYSEWLTEYAKDQGVDLLLVEAKNSDKENKLYPDHGTFSLRDLYAGADLITYPCSCEGFGNPFLEAIYYKKPILINRYHTFIKDIEPKGFDIVTMDGFVTESTVQNVRKILESSEQKKAMVDTNYRLASKHYSYQVLQNKLNDIMFNFFEDSCLQLQSMLPKKSDPEQLEQEQLDPEQSEQDHIIYMNFEPQPAMAQAL